MTEKQKYMLRYYEEHAETIRKRARERARSHMAERVAYNREWRRRNPDCVKFYNKKYNEVHREERRIKAKRYYAEHAEEIRRKQRERYWRQRREAEAGNVDL